MSLLVTGSVGIDTVRTPFGYNEDCIGGSAVHFAMGAGIFTDVKFLGVVGEDFPFDLKEIFQGRRVDLTGLEIRKGSKTFRWCGSYQGDMNEARTESVELNVLAEAPPRIPDSYLDCEYVFLANTAPALQMELLSQLGSPAFVAADTMNHWIVTANDDLKELLDRIDMLILNDGEARLLTGQQNLITAAKRILEMGPRFVVIKKGEHGSMMYTREGDCFILPAYPTPVVIDPTGAGDSFAGGMMGYLAQSDRVDVISLRNAIVYGTVVASFTIGDFSIYGIRSATREMIDDRFDFMRKVTQF
ncbi:MAG TPA: PfkB family carbohydrate kinase [Anaerohalosphaeraceae bacterium]|nr:PfkB family carbohydrate kinase [Anaerohalosphaeraceae bacterium]HOL89023.1 PfkB family carbohydrate kinase [Anaerohalosphaeraceae bacterium]HPP56474.1 PfkB family carbohydrate kinase [Anaerohalosphaeraceae bacterium]